MVIAQLQGPAWQHPSRVSNRRDLNVISQLTRGCVHLSLLDVTEWLLFAGQSW